MENLRKRSLATLLCLFPLAASAVPMTIVDGATLGFYNSALGTILNGTNPVVDDNGVNTFLFPNDGSNPNDPTIDPVAAAPDLSAAAAILGDWLGDPGNLNANWSGPQAIPASWAVNTETAIVYAIDAGATGLTSVFASFGIDNGIFVWLDGSFVGGELRPGGASLGEFTASLGNLGPGTHYLQILREDHGGATGYAVEVTAEVAVAGLPEPPVVALLGIGLLALGLRLRGI